MQLHRLKLALTAGLTFATYLLSALALLDSELCVPQPDDCETTVNGTTCVFHFVMDIFASETGYYRVLGCDGVMPTLGMIEGFTYIFDQSNETNWFHPLGFAYGPDGVYGENAELDPTVTDPVSAAVDCDGFPNQKCQFPQYKLNGENLCSDCEDPADFGLDEYEGVYFHGDRGAWLDAGVFTVEVTITDPATTEIFYFCHIHNFMSGRIKILNSAGVQKNAEDLVAIPYDYSFPDEFDTKCGTHNVSRFQKSSGECPGLTFLCDEISFSVFGQCMHALDCAMHEEMRTSYLDKDPTTTFMLQMIPHHQNAVNMAKVLLKFNPPSLRCGTAYDGRRLTSRKLISTRRLETEIEDEFCHDGNGFNNTPAEGLLWEIINGQNAQITFMRSWLSDNLQPEYDFCPAKQQLSREVKAGLGVLSGVTLLSLIFAAYVVAKGNKAAVDTVVAAKGATASAEEQKI